MTARALVVLAAVLALAAGEAHAINKCLDKKGQVTYQEGRCPDDAQENQFKPMPGPPPDANPGYAPPGTATPAEQEAAVTQLASVQLGYEGCTAANPAFEQQHAAQYDAWRANNSVLLSRYGNTESYRAALAHGRQELKDNPRQDREFLRFCNAQLIQMLGRNIPR